MLDPEARRNARRARSMRGKATPLGVDVPDMHRRTSLELTQPIM